MYIDVHFKPYFREDKLKDIKPMTLKKFYNFFKLTDSREYEIKKGGQLVKKKTSPLSINTIIKLNKFLKSAFNYTVKNDLIKSNPTNKTSLANKEKYTPTVYNEEQFLKLLDFVENTDDEIPIILGGGCGFRHGEIFGLYWHNIDLKNNFITIEKTSVRLSKYKTKKPKNESSKRTIFVSKHVIGILKKYKEKNQLSDSEKVITKWKPDSYSERFKILLKRFGLEHIRMHDLRHYNAIIMMKYGITDKVVAERLGHSQVQKL